MFPWGRVLRYYIRRLWKLQGRISNFPFYFADEEQCSVDWQFVDLINQQKGQVSKTPERPNDEEFVFKQDRYENSVVMPCYRNLDQPQFFYVAEICHHLNPESEFPGLEFKSFREYYRKKYKTEITCSNQPLLDVDHTSARLNLLTPRYVNRKGVALPTSSDETKKAKRENLQQKQILIPELCIVHPFPASLWKKVVCLPSVLYRMNSLLLSEQLRQIVARDLKIGTVKPTTQWPDLSFGWNLADAFKATESGDNVLGVKSEDSEHEVESEKSEEVGAGDDEVDACRKEQLNIGVLSNNVNLEGASVVPDKSGNRPVEDTSDYSDFDDFDGDLVSVGFGCLEIMDPMNQFSLPNVSIDPNLRKSWDTSVGVISAPKSLDAKELVSDLAKNISPPVKVYDENPTLTKIDSIGMEGDLVEGSLPVSQLLGEDDPMIIYDEINKIESFISSRLNKQPVEKNPVNKLTTEPVTVQFGDLLPNRDHKNTKICSTVKPFDFSFDEQVDLTSHPGPSPSILLRALTMSNANDGINLERLETIGDSFLKYAISAYLYCGHTTVHEGKLSYLRSKQVCCTLLDMTEIFAFQVKIQGMAYALGRRLQDM